MELDHSKFVDRLSSFNDPVWPSLECPVFIKDLAEAGFSYTGQSDLVFCHQCGVTVNNWKEGDNALEKHELLNRDCLFLQKRLLSLHNGTINPSSDGSAAETYVFVKGRGVIRRSEINASTPGGQCDGNQNYNADDRLANESMRSEQKRFESFTVCPIRKEWPSPDLLAKGGFYWNDSTSSMYCYCCGCEVTGWETSDQDIKQRHRSLLESCRFVNDLPCGNIEMRDNDELDTSFRKLNMSNGVDSLPTPIAVTTILCSPNSPQPYPPVYSISDECFKKLNMSNGGEDSLPTPIAVTTISCNQNSRPYSPVSTSISVSSPLVSPVTMHYNSRDNKYSFQMSVQNSPLRLHSESLPIGMHEVPYDFRRSSSYPPNQENVLLNGTVVASGQIPVDLSNNSTRLKTFLTYPKDAEVQPVELAEAGFYYINREDCVKCYKCNVMLGHWTKGDTAWNEHVKFSPNCALVKERLQNIRMHRQQQFYPPVCLPSEPIYNHQRPPPQRQMTYDGHYRQLSHTLSEDDNDMLSSSCPNNAMFYDQGYLRGASGYDRRTMSDVSPIHMPNYIQSPSHQGNSYGYVRQLPVTQSPLHRPINPLQMYHQESSSYECDRQPSINKSPLTFNNPHELQCQENKMNASDYLKHADRIIYQDDHSDTHSCQESETPLTMDTSQMYTIDSKYKSNYSPLYSKSPNGVLLHMGSDLDNNAWDAAAEGKRNTYQKLRSHEEFTSQDSERTSSDVDDDDVKCCKICMDAAVEVTFVPCGHLVVCQSCAHGLSMCPICRKDVTNSLRTYFYGN